MRVLPLCLLLCACTTTGDPNRGGLFGWREDKARMRQEELLREIETARTTTQKESEEYLYLKSARADLTQRLAALNELFKALLAENSALRQQIQTLLAQGDSAEAHLAELHTSLETGGQATAESFELLDSEQDREAWVARLREQNLRLRQALDL